MSGKKKLKENSKVTGLKNAKTNEKKSIIEVAMEHEKSKKRKTIKRVILVILIVIIILILSLLGYKFYKRSEIFKKINDNITIEYGEELTLEYILKDNFKKVKVEPKLKSVKKSR